MKKWSKKWSIVIENIYTKEIINEISKRFTRDFGRGFEKANIYHYLQFYKLYPNFVDSVRRQSILSWTHYRILLQVFSKEARDWYEQEALTGSWSVRTLQRNVSSDYYHNNVTTNDTINVTTNDTIKMSELEMLILSEIQKDNHVTRDKLASISGRTSRTIQRALDSLKSKGIIERVLTLDRV